MHLRETPTDLPYADDRCPWWPSGEVPAIGVPLPDHDSFDCVVVGGGYTGLACARRLAALRPHWSIAVLDALRIGEGSAGRNSGFAVDVGHYQPGRGPDGNRSVVGLSRHGIERLHQGVEQAEIDCDWHAGGRTHVAVNARGSAALQRFRDGLEAMGEAHKPISADEIAERLGTEYYREAVFVPGGALVQPAALVRGLASSLPDAVTVFESCPVQRIEPGSPRIVHCEHGRLETPRLVLATNGFSPAWGVDHGRMIPLLTYASMTAPLLEPPGTLAQWGAVPEERMGSTLRLTVDRRILIRNGVKYRARPGLGEVDLARIAAVHRNTFEARFPDLDVALTHTWAGVLGVTINGGTRFGRLAEGAWVAAGYNGVGIALGTALGDLLAYEITDEPHRLRAAAASQPRPGWLPPAPLLGVGLGLYTAVLQRLAGSER